MPILFVFPENISIYYISILKGKVNHIMKKTSDITPSMVEEVEVEFNENREACSICGGRCCASYPCEIYPQDVKRWFGTDTITKDMVFKLLDSGKVQLDWWEGDVRDDEFSYPDDAFKDEYYSKTYYLHMRTVHDAPIEGSWGGPCRCFKRGEGCTLTWDQRPTGGRSLIPEPHGDGSNCKIHVVEKPHCCLAWIPYQDILDAVFDEYVIPDGEKPSDYIVRSLGFDPLAL